MTLEKRLQEIEERCGKDKEAPICNLDSSFLEHCHKDIPYLLSVVRKMHEALGEIVIGKGNNELQKEPYTFDDLWSLAEYALSEIEKLGER